MVNEVHSILKLLIENQTDNYSIHKISKIREINYKSAYQAIKKLEEKKLVELNRIGNTFEISFTKNFDPLVFAVEDYRKEQILKNQNIKAIHKQLFKLNYPMIALLFGSYAKKTNTKHSDIDLLIISEHEKKIQNELNLLPLPIHTTKITNQEFLKMATSKEFNVVNEAIKKNIILIGIEEYYRLMHHVRQKTY